MLKLQKTNYILSLTCSSWHGPPPGWGLHTGSERCCRSSPAPRSPSLQLTTEESSGVRMEQRATAWTVVSLTVLYVCEFTGLLVEGVSQKEEDNAKCNEGRPPSQQEHDNHTTNSAQQRQPFTVKPKGRTPTWRHIHIQYVYHTKTNVYTHSRNSAFS